MNAKKDDFDEKEGTAVPRMIQGVDFQGVPREMREPVLDGLTRPSRWTAWDIKDAYVEADPGSKLAARRHLRNLTQAEVAERAGVRQADVSIAEERFGKSKYEVLVKIAYALGTTVQELIAAPSPSSVKNAETQINGAINSTHLQNNKAQ